MTDLEHAWEAATDSHTRITQLNEQIAEEKARRTEAIRVLSGLGVSNTEIAERLGVVKSTISHYKNGR